MKILRYESRLAKKDESIALQNKVAAEQAVIAIENVYGPFSDAEVEHYRNRLTRGNANIINPLTNELLGYTFYKDLGDPETWKAIPNTTHYIKLLIAAKRLLIKSDFIILPYVLSSRVTRMSTRKVVNKSNATEIKNAALWQQFKMKYNNEKIEQKFLELLGTVKSSTFEIIEWDDNTNAPTINDGKIIPMIDDIIDEELLMFVINI